MDAISAAMTIFGIAALMTSWVLLLITSWKEDYAWGLCSVLLPPLAYGYALLRLDKAWEAIAAAVLGVVLILLA